jgi:hypothetical protein
LMVRCSECKWSKEIDPETRLSLSHENKEILNRLLRSGYRINEFRYCPHEGYLVSNIGKTACDNWEE